MTEWLLGDRAEEDEPREPGVLGSILGALSCIVLAPIIWAMAILWTVALLFIGVPLIILVYLITGIMGFFGNLVRNFWERFWGPTDITEDEGWDSSEDDGSDFSEFDWERMEDE